MIIISISLLFGLYIHLEKEEYDKFSNLKIPLDYYITALGKVKEVNKMSNGSFKILLNTERLLYNKSTNIISINISTKIQGKSPTISKGDFIRINLKLSKITYNRNFYENPVKKYFFSKHIHYSATCKSGYMVSIISKSPIYSIIFYIQRKIERSLNQMYSDKSEKDENKKAFIKAILFGDKSGIENKLKETLLNSGIYHIFVISGAHIAIISFLLIFILKLFKLKENTALFITALCLIFYLIISGFNISATRAVIMALFVILSKLIYKSINIFNIISISGLIILIVDPTDILNPGFILTFSLSIGIIIGREIFLPLIKILPQYTREFVSASLTASIVALPLSLYFFKRYALSGFISSIILIPISIIIIGISFLLFPLFFLPNFFSTIILYILDPFLSIFYFLLNGILSNFQFSIYRASPPLFSILSFFIIFILLTNKNLKKNIKILFILPFIMFLIFFTFPDRRYKPTGLEVYFLDVGQGDSELIVFPSGKALLNDGGGTYASSFEIGKRIVLPFILQKKIKVEWFAVSHSHPDHIKGIIEILKIIKPKEIWLSQKSVKDTYYNLLLKEAKEISKIRYIDSRFKKKEGKALIKCVYPLKVIFQDYARNNSSQILKIKTNGVSVLFTGDIEKETEDFLVKTKKTSLKADILKVPHHGSKTSSTEEFLKAVNPQIAVFSYGIYNRFGFPHKRVINNYNKLRIKLLSTAKSGGIKIIVLKKKIIIEESK